MTIEDKTVNVDLENRQPELEQRFNLHIGKPYRCQVETTVYDGIMNSFEAHINPTGFAILKVDLEDGLMFHPGDPSHKIPFDKVHLGYAETARMGAFGSIVDEEGFERVRERMKERSKCYK